MYCVLWRLCVWGSIGVCFVHGKVSFPAYEAGAPVQAQDVYKNGFSGVGGKAPRGVRGGNSNLLMQN